MTQKEFLKVYTGYHGEEIDNIKQLERHSFTGEELFEFVAHVVSQSKWQTTAKELAQALQNISKPLQYMKSQLKEGETLNGYWAIKLMESPQFYKDIADAALSNYKTLTDGTSAENAQVGYDRISTIEAENKELREMLQELSDLKYIKDKDGKAPYYLERQPLAWTKVRELLNKER